MCLIKLRHLILFLVCSGWFAAQAFTSSINLAYSSWRESIKTSSTTSASGTASFGGFSVSYEAGVTMRNRPYYFAVGLLSAGADARSSDLTTYKINRHKVNGTFVSAALALANQEEFKMRLGLDVLSKSSVWPKQNGVNVNSASFNLGPHIGFDYLVGSGVSFGQKIGSYFSGELFWQLSFGKSF